MYVQSFSVKVIDGVYGSAKMAKNAPVVALAKVDKKAHSSCQAVNSNTILQIRGNCGVFDNSIREPKHLKCPSGPHVRPGFGPGPCRGDCFETMLKCSQPI